MSLVQIYDKYSVDDGFNQFLKTKKTDVYGPKGYVRLLQNKKPITSFMPNLVTAPGRRFVAQKLFHNKASSDIDYYSVAYSLDSTTHIDWRITHFGIGSGGTLIDSTTNTVYFNGPVMVDTDLYDPISLSANNATFLTSPGDSRDTTSHTPVDPTDYVCKPINSVTFYQNTDIDSVDPWYTWVKCECIKDVGEPEHMNDGDAIRIDEAALYYTCYHDNPALTNTQMFSHICFAPKWIEREVELVIEWYILC